MGLPPGGPRLGADFKPLREPNEPELEGCEAALGSHTHAHTHTVTHTQARAHAVTPSLTGPFRPSGPGQSGPGPPHPSAWLTPKGAD
jgi:hypothetical protein